MKFKSYLIFFLLFGVLPDIYICLAILGNASTLWQICLCIPTLAALACLPLIAAGIKYTESLRVFSYLIFIFEFPKFILMLISLLLRIIPSQTHLVTDLIATGVGVGVSVFFMTMIFYVTRHLQVGRLDLYFEKLPRGFDGLRFCQLSDFHLGSFGRRSKYISRIIDSVLQESPELILFTGDLVNFATSEALPYRDELSRLAAPMGIFAIRGNHDYLLHGHHNEEERLKDMKDLNEFETGLGWRVLLNESVTVERGGDSIAIAGVENVSSNPYFEKTGGDLKKTLEGLPEGIFTILLSHDPTHWRREVLPASDIDLTLSGHTHGLKYKLAGMHISSWKLHESAGIYSEGDRILHVSEGLGSAFAFRLGGYPRINMITLHSKA